MLKTDVFKRSENRCVQICKSLNFRSVDTLSAQLHCHMDYFIYWHHTNSTHLPYSSFARNFEFSSLVIRILRSTKSQKSSKKVGAMPPCHPPPPPRDCHPCSKPFYQRWSRKRFWCRSLYWWLQGCSKNFKKVFFWSFLTFWRHN